MARRNTEAEVTYVCSNWDCGEDWLVEGRYDAEGDFEPTDEDNTNCPECGNVGEFREEHNG